MTSNRNLLKTLMGASLVLILSACNLVPAAPAANNTNPISQATVDIDPTLNAIRTQAVATALAEIAAQVTPTTQPTTQPTDTPAPTATAQPVLPTTMPTATIQPVTGGSVATKVPPAYACITTRTTPDFGTVYAPGTDFDATWTVKNTSSKTWGLHEVDYRFLAGTKLYKYGNLFDLPQDVKSNSTITLSVDMTAPTTPGTYSTAWGIVSGTSTVLCELDITIIVK